MSFNYNKLRGKMAEKGYSVRGLSEASGIPVSTLSNKLTGLTEFKSSEILILSKILNIKDIESYFFNVEVRNIERDRR